MKFSHSLQLNAVPEWKDHYLNYNGLKKVTYQLQEVALNHEEAQTGNSSTAVGNSTDTGKSQLSNSVEKQGVAKLKSRFGGLKSFGKKSSSSHENTYELDTVKTSDTAGTPNEDEEEYRLEEVDFVKVTPKKLFESKLASELKKIDAFYSVQEQTIYNYVERLLKDLKYYQETQNDLSRIKTTDTHYHDLEGQLPDDDDDEDLESTAAFSTLLGDREFNLSYQHEVSYKKRITEIFVELSQLKSYVELNKIGFSKACKKFDKVMDENIRQQYMSGLESKCYIFHPDTVDKIDEYLEELIQVYSGVTGETVEQSRLYLRSHLREHIVFERATVWRQMIGIEKELNNATSARVLTGEESEIKNLYALDMYSFKLPFTINLKFTQIEYFKFPKFPFTSSNAYKIYLAAVVFGILLGVKTLNDRTQGNCLAVVAVSAILWATEALPLFVTSLLVPFLVVTCNVLKDSDTGEVMAASDAAAYILSAMWNSTIMLLLGGFTLAAGLSKYNVAKVASSWILHFAGTKPRNVLLAITGVALFLSMWISNVAAPVLAYSLIDPMLKALPTESDFAKALVLGIALVSDVGGMSTPIASPQNMIAIEALSPQPSWGNWFSFSIPLSIIVWICVWVELILTFKISTVKLKPIKPIKEKFTLKQYYVILVTIVTIVLWCLENQMESKIGASGIVSIVPIVALYGTGLLTTTDVNNYPWSIVLLAMGGMALGKAVSSSGLLHTIAVSLSERIKDYPAIAVLAIFGVLCVVFATFVSHTVSALILVPLVQSVGKELNHEYLLVCGISLIASIGMGLPMSGFPNSIAISKTDDLGNRYLSTSLFISRGVPASIIAFAFIITVGYGIMSSIGY